jgi:RNA polymerase sigma-70 factor (ECF subfamily)
MEEALTFEGPSAVASDERQTTDRFGGLFDRHHAHLYALGLRLTWNTDDARDLVQDCFVRAIESGHVPSADQDAERWLVRILVNLCRDRQRRSVVRREHARIASIESAPERHDPGVGPDVRAAVLALPVRQRAIVVLHEIEGHSIVEIAKMLGIAAVTARWHLHTARRTLRGALGR